jgi:hypothetical protein
MKHLTLLNGATLRSEGQIAEEFFVVHASHAQAKHDLDTLKTVIKENDAFAWYRHGISVKDQPTLKFDKAGAIALLEKLGATQKQIAKLTTIGSAPRVDKAK